MDYETARLCTRCKHRQPLGDASRCEYCIYRCVEYDKKRKIRLIKAKVPGICNNLKCQKPIAEDSKNKTCNYCLNKNKALKLITRAIPKREGQCSIPDCNYLAAPGKKMCQKDLDRYLAAVLIRNRKLKTEVMSAYGGKCVCCGESQEQFLSIDHIDKYNGVGPRKSIPLYRYLKNNNYPTGFRVLCMSCNCSLAWHGYCPHGDLKQNLEYKMLIREHDHGSHKRREKLKRKVFAAYGGARCNCCSGSIFEHLTMDHVNNDGVEHRKTVTNLYRWLVKNNFPSGFQVLCANCNFAKGHLGHCPHVDIASAIAGP